MEGVSSGSLIDTYNSEDALSVILKLVGESCNIDCLYCYERRKPYSGSRVLSPDAVSRFLASHSGRQLNIELHGGEPLLYPSTYLEQLVSVLYHHKNHIKVSLQTNATLLTDERLDALDPIKDVLEIGVSLDGDVQSNSFRHDYKGKDTLPAVEKGIAALERRGLPFGIISVVNSRSLGRAAEILDYIAKWPHLNLVKFVPCFDVNVSQGSGPNRSTATRKAWPSHDVVTPPWAIAPQAYSQFLQSVTHHWIEKQYTGRFVLEPVLAQMQVLMGLKTGSCIHSSTKCNHVITLYPDESVGSCDEFFRAESQVSETLDALVDTATINQALTGSSCRSGVDTLEAQCRSCDYFDRCKGGCIATRRRLQTVGLSEAYCNYRKSFIDFIANIVSSSDPLDKAESNS